jgi:hypothetical protein
MLDHCRWCAQSIRVFFVVSGKYRLLVWSLAQFTSHNAHSQFGKEKYTTPQWGLQLEFPARLVRNPISWQVDAYRKLTHLKLVTLWSSHMWRSKHFFFPLAFKLCKCLEFSFPTLLGLVPQVCEHIGDPSTKERCKFCEHKQVELGATWSGGSQATTRELILERRLPI